MPPHHGHHNHHGGRGQRFSNSPGAVIYSNLWDQLPVCYETKDGITRQVLCPIQIPGYPSGFAGDNFGDSVTDLWTALHNLSAKIPAANPGPQPGSSNITQQMLNALGAVAGSVPGIPSDVASALRLLPYGAALLSPEQQAQVADIVKSAASTLASVINAYSMIVPAGGAGVVFPIGTIASYQNGVWRIGVPKGSVGFSGYDLGVGVVPAAIAAGTYKDVGTTPTMPVNATPVDATTFTKATTTPIYKSLWLWIPVGLAAAGTGGYFLLRKKRRRK